MKKSLKISIIIISVIIGLIALIIGFFFLTIDPNINFLGLPELDESQLTSYSRTVKIIDGNGDIIDDVLYDNNKLYVRYSDLQPYTVNAFIAIEDKRFYDHHGVDYYRIGSAIISNIKSRKFREGASTITQQLIKNTHLSNEKTVKRKLSEMRLARKLEQKYSKEQILEGYFNILYFGSGIKGLGTASRVMFDKPASELTLAQSAALASIINNPSKYSPYNSTDALDIRKNTVLKRMHDQGYITDSEYESAKNEELSFSKNKNNQFIQGVLREASNNLGYSEKELFQKNLTIKTSYDKDLSKAARELIQSRHADFNIRILVLDNFGGGVCCDETNSNVFLDIRRSPASTIKPFVSYAPALENGYTPLTQILDEKTSFGDYEPHNYKDIYRGYQSLTDCLIYSSNVASVKLLNDVGLEIGARSVKSFGFDNTDEDNSLAMALGGMKYGTTLTELANAYRTLANGGIFSQSGYVSGIYNNEHSVYFPVRRSSLAVSDDTAYLLTDMLKQCAQRGTAKKLKYSGIIAAKTGTNGDNNGNYDCYCIAYTPKKTIAVWFGADKTPIDNKITGAACAEIIATLCKNGNIDTNEDFIMPKSVAYYEIDDKELRENHEVYLADPMLPRRYRRRALLSKKHLPIHKNTDYLDFFDGEFWKDYEFFDEDDLQIDKF